MPFSHALKEDISLHEFGYVSKRKSQDSIPIIEKITVNSKLKRENFKLSKNGALSVNKLIYDGLAQGQAFFLT
jgi:hypothetical protein